MWYKVVRLTNNIFLTYESDDAAVNIEAFIKLSIKLFK
jgi:hypothetical protein